ncbi:MAG: hypothetical protein V3571_13155 [Pseudodesulfovibrio sp.]
MLGNLTSSPSFTPWMRRRFRQATNTPALKAYIFFMRQVID